MSRSESSLFSYLASRAGLLSVGQKHSSTQELGFQFYAYPEQDTVSPSKIVPDLAEYTRVFAEAHAHEELYRLDANLEGVLSRIAPFWRIQDIPRLYSRSSEGIIAFDDSWTGFGWSQWWVNRHLANPLLDVVILHADDHADLTSPFLVQAGENWVDPFTQRPVSSGDPDSFAAAVVSGAIGIGCFIIPWMHTWRSVQVRHLCIGLTQPVRSRIEKSVFREERFAPDSMRLSIAQHASDGLTSSGYLGTEEPECWSDQVPEAATVLLHIDLDYFNDRHGGGRASTRPEPSLDQMGDSVQRLCDALAAQGLPTRVEYTAIALSPGFCPSEHWEFLLSRLRQGLKRIGCPCP